MIWFANFRLLSELSTPFLNFRWMMQQRGIRNSGTVFILMTERCRKHLSGHTKRGTSSLWSTRPNPKMVEYGDDDYREDASHFRSMPINFDKSFVRNWIFKTSISTLQFESFGLFWSICFVSNCHDSPLLVNRLQPIGSYFKHKSRPYWNSLCLWNSSW